MKNKLETPSGTVREGTILRITGMDAAALKREKNISGIEATYDVIFSPMVNVKIRVRDPLNPTEAEQEKILELAKEKIADSFDEKLGRENASMIRLYTVDRKKVPRHHVFGNPEHDIDPEIVLELTHLLHNVLYEKEQDGVLVSRLILDLARELSERHKNTDWEETDFWLTMEREAETFLVGNGYRIPAPSGRLGLVTWPESQQFLGKEGVIHVSPPENDKRLELDQALLVPESVTGAIPSGEAYQRVTFPESQAWEKGETGSIYDLIHASDTQDIFVLESLIEKVGAPV